MAGPTLSRPRDPQPARGQLSNFSKAAAHAAEISTQKVVNMNAQKNFLIFGGIGGIGGALCDVLAAQGHYVIVTTSKPEKNQLTTLAKEQVLTVDVRDHQSIRDAVAMAGAQGLHGMAYCVGTIDIKPLARTTAEDLRNSLEIIRSGHLSRFRRQHQYSPSTRVRSFCFLQSQHRGGFQITARSVQQKQQWKA